MVMVTRQAIEAMLERDDPPSLTEYRNAQSALRSWMGRTTDPYKLAPLQALADRVAGLAEPEAPAPISQSEALQRGRAVNEARAIGRGRTQLLARLSSSQWGRVSVSSDRPFLFEAALQLIEDGEVSFQSSQVGGRRGPARAEDRDALRRVWIGPKGAVSEWTLAWKSKRDQAQEERI